MKGGFDGFYTYFASNDFTYGSSWKNWKSLSSFAKKYFTYKLHYSLYCNIACNNRILYFIRTKRNHLLFVPSVGPGYIDTRVRPWNGKTTKERHKVENPSILYLKL